MDNSDVVIVAAKRTPIGSFLGSLSSIPAPKLGGIAHTAALEAAGLAPKDIQEVISGCVLSAGLGQAPARQAAIHAQIPISVGATTINKICGSGMKAVMLAADAIRLGSANIVLASGMENMSLSPYLLAKARSGYRMGHGEIKDHMFLDGLEDAYEPGKLMGYFADKTANEYQISREKQDAFAIQSMSRALTAQDNQAFAAEICPVLVHSRHGDSVFEKDENPDRSKIAKVTQLKPAFNPEGSITAASSSAIADGAASLILMNAREARKRGIQPLARIVAQCTYSQKPALFASAPVFATQKIIEEAGWTNHTVDLFEINEAFAVVALAVIKTLGLDDRKVNIHGGACALGHPIGASGARILVTLLHALRQQGKSRGVASLCIGGGEATAMAIEIIN